MSYSSCIRCGQMCREWGPLCDECKERGELPVPSQLVIAVGRVVEKSKKPIAESKESEVAE